MEDEHPPDDSAANSADEASIDTAREEDLDALLAEASDLATEVSDEVGLSEDPSPAEAIQSRMTDSGMADAQTSAASGQDEPSPSDDVDSQMAQVDDLLRDTADQVGCDSEGSVESSDMEGSANVATASGEGPHTPDEPNDKVESVAAPEVPAFMDEFVNPVADACSEVAQPGDKASAPELESGQRNAPAGLDTTTTTDLNQNPAKIGVVSSMPSSPDGIIESSGATAPPPISEPLPEASSVDVGLDPTDKAEAALVPRLTSRLTPAAIRACQRGVDLLERLDAPVRWLGDGTRRVIGWVALATLGTSVIALIISFF